MDVQTTFVESSLMTLIEFGVREGHKMKGFLQTIFIFSTVLATGEFISFEGCSLARRRSVNFSNCPYICLF